MTNDKFSLREAYAYGWQTFREHVPLYIGMVILLSLVTIIPDVIAENLFPPRSFGLIFSKIFLRVFSLILGLATTRLSLNIYDEGDPKIAQLPESKSLIIPYVLAKLLFMFLLFIGFICFVVPSLIVAYMFVFSGYLIIDRGLDPIASLKESHALTNGYKWPLGLFYMSVAAMNLPAFLFMAAGVYFKSDVLSAIGFIFLPTVLVTLPVTLMASAYVYRHFAPAENAMSTSASAG